jgi:chitinase
VGAGVAHDQAGNGNNAGTSTDNTVTYDGSALPSLSIGTVTVTEGNTGTANATFTVTLSVASGQTVTVNYATANGTAVAPGDYTARSGVVTFPIGTTTQQVTVPVVGDTLSEVNEQFTVNLSNPSGATISSGQGSGTITDNDPLPSLSINNVTGTANATFTVTLAVASGQTVTVNYATTDATATAPADYNPTSGLLTFPAGTLTRQIVVPVVGDLLDENAETYTVTLSGASGATIGTAFGTGTITDNDATPSLTIDNVAVTEGNAGSTTPAIFTVTLSAVSGRQVTVNYATANNTATAASGDYTSVMTTTLAFPPGVTTRTIDVLVLGDTLYEAAETFRVNLSAATNSTLATSQGTGTILDDDTPPSLTIGSPVVTETNSGSTTMTFVVSQSVVSGVNTTVDFATADGTATAGIDYTARTGTLTIAAGSVSGTIAITRFGDTVPEADETLFVDLSGPTNATIAQSRGTGTITDNDGTVTVTSPNTAVTWNVGSARIITWTTSSNFAAGATFGVELSRNGGSTYELIAGSVPNATSTSGSYNWTVTGPATTQGRVRVTWTVNGRVTDISNSNFTITP